MSRNLIALVSRLSPADRAALAHRLKVKANVAEERHGEDSEKATRAFGRVGAFSAITANM